MTREELAKANAILAQINHLQQNLTDLSAIKNDSNDSVVIRAGVGLHNRLVEADLSDVDFASVIETAIDVVKEKLSDLENEFNAL